MQIPSQKKGYCIFISLSFESSYYVTIVPENFYLQAQGENVDMAYIMMND